MNYELRTVIKGEDIDRLITYFDASATKKDVENQVIYNYHTEGEFRLIRSKEYAELDLRTNEEENTVYISKKYEKDLIKMFKNIGIAIDFKRFRTRYKYIVDSFYITIDKNIKTGNILRAKFSYTNDEDKKLKIDTIKKLFIDLNIEETSLDKFQEIYGKYRTSWNDLVGDIDEDEFLK